MVFVKIEFLLLTMITVESGIGLVEFLLITIISKRWSCKGRIVLLTMVMVIMVL